MGAVRSAQVPLFGGLPDKRTLFIGTDPHAVDKALGLSDDLLVVSPVDAPTVQLQRRFHVAVIMAPDGDDGQRRSLIHCAVQHLEPKGHLVVVHHPDQLPLCDGFSSDDLRRAYEGPMGMAKVTVFVRGERTTVHDLLYEARATIKRVTAIELSQQLGASYPPLVLDTRTHTDRGRFGVILNSVHVPRTVVEWHFDPANGYLHPAMQSFDQQLVVVCNSGYSSSLAAANLVRIGFRNVADLIGGHTAWCAAGLPIEHADHSHLDTPST